jgi:segregation and condensation protein B
MARKKKNQNTEVTLDAQVEVQSAHAEAQSELTSNEQANAEQTSEIDVHEMVSDLQAPVDEQSLELAPQGADENSQDAQPFDESQLLELAQNEGLIDLGVNETIEGEEDIEIDLPEADQAQILASLETVLFMSDKPVSLSRLRQIIGTENKLAVYRKLAVKLRNDFAQDHRGIELAEVSGGFQFRTKPHMSAVLRKMVKTQPLKLSGTNMEVLAIIAYKQPVTKDDIDQIRGVDSGYVLRTLMEKRLVKITGRSELPGRPMLYGTSHEFLELFNLKDLAALPPLHEVEAMVAASEVGAEEKMLDALSQFGEMVATSDKILFDDSKLDEELEAIRTEIASIPTSTTFIDEQKAHERLQTKLAELAQQGLTLDAEGKVVPIGTTSEAVVSVADPQLAEPQLAAETSALELAVEPAAEHAPVMTDYTPSPELIAEAEAATTARLAEMVIETTQEVAMAPSDSTDPDEQREQNVDL